MLNRRTSGALGGFALLLFGVAIGIATDRLVLRHHPPASGAETDHRMALQHFQELFDLDDEQVAEIDAVFRRQQGAVAESWTTVQPHLRSAIESVHLRMSEILRPEQQQRFYAWLEEQGAHEIVIEHDMHRERHDPPR